MPAKQWGAQTMQSIESKKRVTQDVGRLPPHSVEAEQAVLGGLLLCNDAWDNVCEIITTTDAFYVPEHRVLWKAIQGWSRGGSLLTL
jgi:replicative DNA helicase